jgi:hypothetical protein
LLTEELSAVSPLPADLDSMRKMPVLAQTLRTCLKPMQQQENITYCKCIEINFWLLTKEMTAAPPAAAARANILLEKIMFTREDYNSRCSSTA